MHISVRALSVAACLLAFAQTSKGQAAGGAMMNPMMNPYINPYLAGATQNNPDMLLYMYSVNQMNGGIGTGQISGTRPIPGQVMGPQGQSPAQMNQRQALSTMKNAGTAGGRSRTKVGRADALMPLATSVPGSGAAGFFNRGFNSSSGAGQFYNRTSGRFQNNGR